MVALPIVSHALRCRTRLFSLSILLVAKDNASVTATGRPSGTATTIMVMATMRMSRKAEPFIAGVAVLPDKPARNRITRIKNNNPAALVPKYPIQFAIPASFTCNGVSSFSVCSDIMTFP